MKRGRMQFRRSSFWREAFGLCLAAVLVLGLSISAAAGPIVDRVVANVNGHVVLQSDWEEEVSFEAFEDGKDPATFTDAERKAALDRLIDQELLREQVRPSQPAPPDQVAARVAEVRKLQPNGATDAGWHAALAHCGLTQKALENRLSDQIQLMKLVEDRLRPSVQIDQQAVERYYHDELLPELKKAGGQAKPLTEVYGRIRTVLAEKKLNELLTGWITNLRSEGHILTHDAKSGEQNR
ncbi:MAG: SurA N-terminal domain-containing protein [Terriglobales bacterium]